MRIRLNENAGFSLMELMVVVSIIGILSAIATPNVFAWLQNRHFTASVQRTISVMNGAKMRAVKENVPVVILFDKGRNRFDAFVDLSNPPNFAWDENIDRRIDSYVIPSGVHISKSTFTSIEDNRFRLVFTSRGMPADFNNGRVVIESDRGLSNDIVVSVTGRIQVE